jgi:hypothetical protein
MASILNSAGVTATVRWDYQSVVTGVSPNVGQQASFTTSISYVNGANAAANQCDLLYVVTGTIAASGNTVLALNGSATDFFGLTINMLRVKAMYVALTTATSATSIQVGGGSNPMINYLSGTTPTVNVRNGGVMLLGCLDTTGWPVTASTGMNVKLLNNDGANVATYNCAFIGASA